MMYTALDISSRSIKALSLKGRQVKRWGSLALADETVRDGLILDPKALGEAIDGLFRSDRISRERVIASVAGLSYTYRFLNLPRLKPALMEEAILRAARKEFSLPLGELYLTWQALPGGVDEQAFFVLGVPKNLVDAVFQTLAAADIEPYQMDLRPLALARAAGRGDAIVVNMEPDSFDIVFITAGLPTVIHTISPRRDGATLEDNIRRLADELAKMAAFYQSGHPESPLSPATPLLLTGELAAGPPAIGLLQGEVEYPVAPLLPPVALPPELPAASFTASIGLALKKTNIKTPRQGDAPFHDININIFTGKNRRSRAPHLPAGYIITGVLLAAAIVFLYPFYQAAWQLKAGNSARLAELDNLTREVGLATLTAEETVKKEETLREIITGTRAVRSVRESILGDRGNFTDYLGKVTLALPPGTDFTSVEMDSGRVTLQGEADSVFTVIDYATALEAAGAFREVRITRLDEAESAFSGEAGNVIKFEIIMSR